LSPGLVIVMIDERTRIDTIGKLPVLGVCGWSGSGKTTLIERVLPRLLARNLKIAVVKHDVHTVDVDRPGKDSDRFFQAGADVFLQGNEELTRRHPDPTTDLVSRLIDLARRYDLVLVEGHKQSPLPKVWLLHEGENGPPANITDIKLVLGRDAERLDEFLAFLTGWLTTQWLKTPVYGCICANSNGRPGISAPEQLSTTATINRLQQIREQLEDVTENIVIVGNSGLTAGLADWMHLVHPPGLTGPLSGILTVMRWQPLVSWFVVDIGRIDRDCWQRTLAQRAPGVWAILPAEHDDREGKPFPAYYDFRAAGMLENVTVDKDFFVRLGTHRKVIL
jgi:molybdopterin-guanine dinucleotide biosynthesis protein MobB